MKEEEIQKRLRDRSFMLSENKDLMIEGFKIKTVEADSSGTMTIKIDMDGVHYLEEYLESK